MCVDITANKYQVVTTTIGYLLGVPTKNLADKSVVSACIQNKPANIVRDMCILRSTLIKHYDAFSEEMRVKRVGLYGLVENQVGEVLHRIRQYGVNIWSFNLKNVYEPIETLNGLISDRINNCKDLFPDWLDWHCVREAFIMPNGKGREGIEAAVKLYKSNSEYCPKRMYVNIHFYENGKYILGNDYAICHALYESCGKKFTDVSKVSDAKKSVKKKISAFLEESQGVVIAVDCENSDPYKMCATLASLSSSQSDKIKKIILIDDINASSAWRILGSYTSIPVETVRIERVLRGKSLVDITLSSVVCKEHYANGVNSVMLFSSDSDYWGLASTLPAVKFFVMVEAGSCSETYKESLSKKGIQYCCIDDFYTGDSDEIKYMALRAGIEESLKSVNVISFLDSAIANARATLSDAERTSFIQKYLLSGYISISSDGSLQLNYPTDV